MTVTSLRRRATDPVLPPAIDMDSFRHVTAVLTSCATDAAAADQAGGAERQRRLARAIHANMELWGDVMHAALHGASGLPQPLRAHLLELAEVSIRHGSHVLRGAAGVDPLIVVNRSIIEGLQLTGGRPAALADR